MTEPAAITLAKAHLQTIFSDFIIFGLDSRQKPVITTEIPCCQSENNRQVLINEYLKIHKL